MELIVDKFVREINEQLAGKKVEISLTPKARKWMAEHGHDPKFGARPLARLLQSEIKDPLADAILFGSLEKGGKVLVDVKKDKIILNISKR